MPENDGLKMLPPDPWCRRPDLLAEAFFLRFSPSPAASSDWSSIGVRGTPYLIVPLTP